MVPKVTRGGSSFKGAFRYYLHDKGAETSERIEWAQMENMSARSPDQAWRAMAYTARVQERLKEASGQSRAGRKLEKPVFAFSLAWHPEQTPDREHMLETARAAIRTLGLEEHEAMIVSHADEPQKHVHVIVNRVHPLTGMAGDVSNSKRKFSDFAREYEQKQGKIYCRRRAENHARRQEGEPTLYADPHIEQAWTSTSCGEEFRAALQGRGYTLARGRKRLVIVDPHGKAHNPTRVLRDVKAADIQARLDDIDAGALPDADEITTRSQPARKAERKPSKPAKQRRQTEQDRAAFNRLAEAQFAALTERQGEDRERVSEEVRQRIAATKKRLIRYYELPEKKEAIQNLREKIENAPWWKRLFGVTRKDRHELQCQVKTYKDAMIRYRDGLSHAEQQGARELSDLQGRQVQEQNKLVLSIERVRERNDEPHERTPRRVRSRDTRPFDRGMG